MDDNHGFTFLVTYLHTTVLNDIFNKLNFEPPSQIFLIWRNYSNSKNREIYFLLIIQSLKKHLFGSIPNRELFTAFQNRNKF